MSSDCYVLLVRNKCTLVHMMKMKNGIDSILASFSIMLARTVYHCTISSARRSVAIRRLKKEVNEGVLK